MHQLNHIIIGNNGNHTAHTCTALLGNSVLHALTTEVTVVFRHDSKYNTHMHAHTLLSWQNFLKPLQI